MATSLGAEMRATRMTLRFYAECNRREEDEEIKTENKASAVNTANT